MKSRTLLFLAIVILAMYGISRWLANRGEPNFSPDLMRVDTARVTMITIAAPQSSEISLQREGRLWIASNGQTTMKMPPDKINPVLETLATVKMDSLVAHEADTWKAYGLSDEAGTRIRVYAGSGPGGFRLGASSHGLTDRKRLPSLLRARRGVCGERRAGEAIPD